MEPFTETLLEPFKRDTSYGYRISGFMKEARGPGQTASAIAKDMAKDFRGFRYEG